VCCCKAPVQVPTRRARHTHRARALRRGLHRCPAHCAPYPQSFTPVPIDEHTVRPWLTLLALVAQRFFAFQRVARATKSLKAASLSQVAA
jgi:hypothetical protein